jgi:hypothetical protein
MKSSEITLVLATSYAKNKLKSSYCTILVPISSEKYRRELRVAFKLHNGK